MWRRFKPARWLSFGLSIVLLGPIGPWSALRFIKAPAHALVACHHMACPHHGRPCTCHSPEGTPLWQRCNDASKAMPGSTMPYGPLPAPATVGMPEQATRHVPHISFLCALRLTADIFHPPRSL
ncbi:hypothetical protein [Rhodothermus bifroesti]|uniref:Uncharacterized protein n=1 Tax=Rhodothermus marinus TaxID=29549 RepID=A0A7V2AZX5_RHOMR|nr:hypothetical protein [Rhodothermus bifroesti]